MHLNNPDDETPFAALDRAAAASAEKDELTSSTLKLTNYAITAFRRSRVLVVIAILALTAVIILGLVFFGPKINTIYNNSQRNSHVLVCTANGYNQLAHDLRVLARSGGHAKASAYMIPRTCNLGP